MDDKTRMDSFGWKALCYCIGHPVETSILSPYLQAFQNLTEEQRNADIEGQMTPLFKYNKKRRICTEFERYKRGITESAEVYLPSYDKDSIKWDSILKGLRKRSIDLSSNQCN